MAPTPHPRSCLRRTACDRCRHSKLKCFRDENQPKCARCLRLELRCSVAPAKPPGRPRKAVSPKATAGESADHLVVLPVDTLECGNREHPDAQNNSQPRRSSDCPEDLLLDTHGLSQTETFFNRTLLPMHSNAGVAGLIPSLPPSESRTPEWHDTSAFGFECAPSRDPLEVHSLFTANLDRHECLKELSQLNVDLHVLWKGVRELQDSNRVGFLTFCEHPPPPAGDGVSLAEKILIMAQRFQQAITNLGWVVKNEPKPLHRAGRVVADDAPRSNATESLLMPLSQEAASDQATPEDDLEQEDGVLETPFVCVLVSCYVQTIELWETMFFHVQRRTTGIDREPLILSDPSKGVQLGAFYIFSGRLVSMFYCQAVVYFLDNIDRGLGLLPEQREQGASGLLSHPRHFNLLKKELGTRSDQNGIERVYKLKDEVEKARLCSLHDIGW